MKRRLPRILYMQHVPKMQAGGKGKLGHFGKHLIIGYLLFLAGVTLGCVCSLFSGLPAVLSGDAKLSSILLETLPFDFGGYFLESFAVGATAVMLVFILGFTAAAVPVIAAIPAFRGIGFGVMMTGIYRIFDLKGILVCAAAVLPYAALTVFSLCMLSADAVCISGILTRYLFLSDTVAVRSGRLKAYFIKLLLSVAAAALAALVHCGGVYLLLPII